MYDQEWLGKAGKDVEKFTIKILNEEVSSMQSKFNKYLDEMRKEVAWLERNASFIGGKRNATKLEVIGDVIGASEYDVNETNIMYDEVFLHFTLSQLDGVIRKEKFRNYEKISTTRQFDNFREILNFNMAVLRYIRAEYLKITSELSVDEKTVIKLRKFIDGVTIPELRKIGKEDLIKRLNASGLKVDF
jgi:hypothetical protein